MIIIKIIILYFIQIRHTDDFPSTGTRLVIIMAELQLFNVAGYLIEEKRRWPIITASPREQCSK